MKPKLKSKISEESAPISQNMEFFVVEKPQTPEDDPMQLAYKSDPISFGRQMMGGLMPQQIHGFYSTEDEALNASHDLVQSVYEAATALEAKKGKVSSKMQKVMEKLEKEVSKNLKLAKESPHQAEEFHLKAEQLMEKIKNLRYKHKIVEKSKKTILDKDLIKKKK